MKTVKIFAKQQNEMSQLLEDIVDSVTTINIVAHILQDEKVKNNKEENDDLISSINQACWHMSQKIREFMYAKNISEINFDYNKLKRKIDLREKLQECALRVAKKNKRTSDIALNFDEDPKIIFANEEHITFLLDELIQRAFQNSKSGKVVIVGLISVSWNEILVSINDFGEDPQKSELVNLSYQKIDINSFTEYKTTMKLFEKIVAINGGELSIYKKQTPGTMVMINFKNTCNSY